MRPEIRYPLFAEAEALKGVGPVSRDVGREPRCTRCGVIYTRPQRVPVR